MPRIELGTSSLPKKIQGDKLKNLKGKGQPTIKLF